MPERVLLKKQIIRSWTATIQNEYDNQLINSERGLQFYFCRHLLEKFKSDNVNRTLFIEPRISTGDPRESRYPDIVICNRNRIISVIEIKYQPRSTPDFAKDLATLNWIRDGGSNFNLTNERFLGKKNVGLKAYKLDSDAILCWAGVYKTPSESNFAEILLENNDSFNKSFLSLHASTKLNSHAEIFPEG